MIDHVWRHVGVFKCAFLLRCCDSANARRDYSSYRVLPHPNEAEQPLTLLFYRPASACNVSPQNERGLSGNGLTTLPDGVFEGLESLTDL